MRSSQPTRCICGQVKTFEEALNHVMPAGKGPDELQAAIATLEVRVERNQALAQEAIRSDRVRAFIEQLIQRLPVGDAMMSVFLNGVMVGIEMEKSDTGGVRIE